MEEDTGKSTHVGGATGRIHGASHSLLDYNRAGIPLIEIVTKPIEGAGERAPEVARAYVAELRELIKALGVSEARMEMGQMRCDVNLSLRPHGREKFGTRSPRRRTSTRCAVRGARRPLRDPAARRGAQLRRHDHPGDPALPRGGRLHHLGPREGGGRGLPVLPRARPGAGRPVRASGSRSSAPGCRSCRWLRRKRLQSTSGASPTTTCSPILNAGALDLIVATIDAGRGRRLGPQVVDGRAGPQRQRDRASSSPSWPITPAQVARVAALVAAGRPERQAGPPGHRGRARGRGRPGRGRREARPEGRLRRLRARHGRRRGHRGQRGASPTRSAAARSPRPARWSAR